MNTYQIRDIREDEMDSLMELIAAHAAYEKADYTPEGNKKERLYEAIFNEPCRLKCWVVEYDGKISGFCSFTTDYSTWEAGYYLNMDCLYLNEEIRGFGIGAAIIKRLRHIAKENNCCSVQWHTPLWNLRGINFYNKTGASSGEKMRFTLLV
jgi:GNAT superfamily N-acetyltransferase